MTLPKTLDLRQEELMTSQPKKYICDFTALEETIDNDQELMKQLIQMYLKSSASVARYILIHYATKNFSEMHNVLHKFLNSVDMLSIQKLSNPINKILNANDMQALDMRRLIPEILHYIKQSQNELRIKLFDYNLTFLHRGTMDTL